MTTSRSPRPALPRERLLTELRAFVEDNYLYLRPELELQDTDRLLELRIMDSLGFVELVEEVRTRYAISVADVDITEENFGSIAAIADLRGSQTSVMTPRTLDVVLRASAGRVGSPILRPWFGFRGRQGLRLTALGRARGPSCREARS